MRQKRPAYSVQQDILEALRLRGVESDLLDARLEYMDLEGVRRYVAAMQGQDRVYPSMLPTQASGRWSTTEPPLVNFPASIRDVVEPDPDEWCLSFDFDSVEARLFMGHAGDEDDLTTIRRGHDIHTLTACALYDLALPPDPRDPHTGVENEAWRAQVSWKGEKDPRRQVAKSLRYACVPMDTLALTRRGWCTFEEIQIGEDVLSYNSEKHHKEWVPVENKVYYESAEVWEVGHSWTRFRATPDHRWFVRQRRQVETRKGRSKVRWETRPSYLVNEVRTTSQLSPHSCILMNAPMWPDLLSQQEDGLLRSRKYTTDWSAKVLAMSSSERQSFLAGFLIADGHSDRRNGSWCFSQARGPLFEAALLASYLEHHGVVRVSRDREGVKPGKPIAIVRFSTKSHITGQALTQTRLPDQPVWCLTTRNGSWVMRQGDLITITGNCLQYGTNEHAASNIRDIEKLGMTRTELYTRARKLLHSKPRYMAWKMKTWGEAVEEGISRTFLGRKRRLFPTTREKIQWRERRVPGETAREGLNHRIQGATADIMNSTLIAITREFPAARLFVNRHDGAELGFPVSLSPEVALPRVTPLIAKVWLIGGTLVPLTASGSILRADGRKEAVKFGVPA